MTAEQYLLPGFEAALPPINPVFFALFPPADAAARVARVALLLRREHELSGRPLATERFHVSLLHLDDRSRMSQATIAAAGRAVATVAMPPFDRAASFGRGAGRRPFVLRGGDGVAGLMAFQQALGGTLKQAGLVRRAMAQYEPHVTLLYDDRPVDEQAIEVVRWTVRELVLVRSLQGQTRHVPLARWTLRG